MASGWMMSAAVVLAGAAVAMAGEEVTTTIYTSTREPDPASEPWNGTVFWDTSALCEIDTVPQEARCAYVTTTKDCLPDSRVHYLQFAYCSLGNAIPFVYILLFFWLCFLFLNLVLVLDSRVVPNINIMSKMFGMSDSVAGVTLLAFGNGAADVFSAAAAVTSSDLGTTLAISGLVGGGLYVVTVVTGVLAFYFQPELNTMRLFRDAGSYFMALCIVSFIIYFDKLHLWQCVMLLFLHVMYVAWVVVSEREHASMEEAAEKTALLPQQSPIKLKGKLKNSSTMAMNPAFDRRERDLEQAAVVAAAAQANPGPIWEEHDGSWSTTLFRARQTIFDTWGESWSDKSILSRILIVFQIPMHFALYITTAVMHHGDAQRTWDRNIYMVTTFFMLPTIALIMFDDAFYSDGSLSVVPLLIMSAVGLVLAAAVRVFTRASTPPKIQWWFSVGGFLVSLAWIYALSEEIVSLLSVVGVMMSVSPALIGMTVLGIGNGTCDMVANYLMARAGYPSAAIAAIYAGPMFNLLIGLGVAGIAGNVQYKEALDVSEHRQLYMGMLFVGIAIILGVVLGSSGEKPHFSKGHAFCFFTSYFLFLLITCTLYA